MTEVYQKYHRNEIRRNWDRALESRVAILSQRSAAADFCRWLYAQQVPQRERLRLQTKDLSPEHMWTYRLCCPEQESAIISYLPACKLHIVSIAM